jgi:medium-chain acyl-[acyl-carrier-protein] hydrolase
MADLHEISFDVRYHELDYNGNLKPLALLHYLQDCAGLHASKLGVSVKDLHSLGLTWVLSRLHMTVERYQRADESILIRTWPSTRHNLFTCREFEAVDKQNHITAKATTSWAAVKLSTRRPVRLDQHLPNYPMLAVRSIEDNFDRLPPFPNQGKFTEIPFKVLRTDLDINHHVNNVIYISWALEAVPDNIAACFLAELEVSFKGEALYGEHVISRCTVTEEGEYFCCLHQISNQTDDKELVIARTRWRR